MKKFFAEFKKFITRGNVIDMAVGVIVGGAFTAIVNSVTNNVLKPLVNWFICFIMGGRGFEDSVTMLKAAYTTDESGAEIIDLANSIYIDWGVLITAIINFIITAFVLFLIVKAINKMKEESAERLTKEEKAELKKRGIKVTDKKAVEAYMAEKAAAKAKAEAEAAQAAAEKAAADRLANPTTEDLLKQILAEMRKN